MRETGTFFAPTLGYHVQLDFDAGRLVSVRITDRPDPATSLSPAAQRALELVARHLETGREDLRAIPVDFGALPPFHRRTLELLRDVPPGRPTTYGELARRLGEPGASRAVGGAMAANPMPIVVPCHRVLQSGGGLGNYSGMGGPATKAKLLALESVLKG